MSPSAVSDAPLRLSTLIEKLALLFRKKTEAVRNRVSEFNAGQIAMSGEADGAA